MHRINATPGGWNPNSEGVVFIQQTPAPIVFLSATDTDIQTLATAQTLLPSDFPQIRVTNLLHLQQQLTIDTYAEQVLNQAKVIILRLLGGSSYWSYGLEVLLETTQHHQITLIVIPGDNTPDPDLITKSTVPLTIVNQVERYFSEGGIDNILNALLFIGDSCLGTNYHPPKPLPLPRVGYGKSDKLPSPTGSVGILFYRAHYLAGNTAFVDALATALIERNLQPVPIFISSFGEDIQDELLQLLRSDSCQQIGILLNTTSFSVARLASETPQLDLWQTLDVPVLQVINSSGTEEQWSRHSSGLSPRDMAMNVALPEVDGKIITRAVSFKTVKDRNFTIETDVVVYQPQLDRIAFVADLAASYLRLRSLSEQDRRIALILANYPTRDGRLANGVGLDTPASCVEILKALQAAGYKVENIPQTGEELIARLTSGITNDLDTKELRPVNQSLSGESYREYFAVLPAQSRRGMSDRWGEINEEDDFPIPGIQLGNVFVGIQPSRGYDQDPSLNYHAPDLEPTHAYLAFYYWVRECFRANAVVHVGKHGNLEWLPGKSVALSSNCYPEVALGALPHFYPFIVNDPGEGSQAKRRAHAVILDHLTPPMTRAELYGGLQKLENLIDEYYEAASLDPSRLSLICDRVQELLVHENLHLDLGLTNKRESLPLTQIDAYLCELKQAQIRDGLHIFGQCPQGRQLRDLIVAIARHPHRHHIGLTRAIALGWGLDFDPRTADLGGKFSPPPNSKQELISSCRTVGDVVEVLEEQAALLVEQLIADNSPPITNSQPLSAVLNWIAHRLLPALQQTDQEITHLLHGLDGGYVKSAPAGAPTRGRPEVLPTGRNFYSVDIRAIPTETAWDVGARAAEAVIERYVQDQGEYPKALGLSVWSTSTMRTGGDDIAEALALLGVQPVWDGIARRVVDFEILPLRVLGRPRVDVTLRISGAFRDAFPNLIDLFAAAVQAVGALDEPAAENPLRAHIRAETEYWTNQGLSLDRAVVRSHYRIFGSKPGAYGAGLQGLIESQNWTTSEDLARAYINWSCYAYSGSVAGASLSLQGDAAPEAFQNRLQQMEIVLHNQDNREHDLLDSDDYYQFQGGLTAAVRSVSGKNPQIYFGDNSRMSNPRVQQLSAEIKKVYRSRVVNPKWIAGVMRHGYKGACEMAATVDYLFAYDATTNCVEDYMYQGIAEAYLFAPSVQEFVQQKNPWALRDMAERLLEANQRGLWENVEPSVLNQLRNLVHQAEAVIESTITS
ncbi:MAG: cobaltochelatase subunit CobN [Nostocaceae cyanobacterium]|nr:cobaltochelatase subunit CobN [Nostocaceae cyanobacterium]